LRRLYSTFADSWPGGGLLLMRLVVGSVVLVRGGAQLWSNPALPAAVTSASLTGSGSLLIAGLWTPLAGAVVAVVEISHILAMDGEPLVCVLAATIAVALAMLGPGRWSLDARLFGWKRIDATPRRRSPDAL
jgi:putative oxidoreductase